jgi:hypothetical protein
MNTLKEKLHQKRFARYGVSPRAKQVGEMNIRLDDGRLVPVLSGGMVEISLNELGARLVAVEPASPSSLN